MRCEHASIGSRQHVAPLGMYDPALRFDNLFVLAECLADFKILALNNALHVLNGLHFRRSVPQSFADAEPFHQVVFEANKESR